MKNSQIIILILFLVVVSFISGFYVSKSIKLNDSEYFIDTVSVIVRDTVVKPVPQPADHFTRFDSIPDINITWDAQIGDTVRDTAYIYVPILRKEYRTEDYFAVVEGYNASLSFIETYNKTVYVDRIKSIKSKTRWGIGLQMGVGTDFKRINPYVGIGVQYNIFSW